MQKVAQTVRARHLSAFLFYEVRFTEEAGNCQQRNAKKRKDSLSTPCAAFTFLGLFNLNVTKSSGAGSA